ncbi:MAG: autotransporter domain-containing protein [Methylomonas sp.]
MATFADQVSTDVTWSVIGRIVNISEPSFESVGNGTFSGNTANVTSGSSVTLSGTYSIQEGDTSYCPGCVIQLYTAWISPATAGSEGFFSGVIFPVFGTQTGSIIGPGESLITLTAPKTPGAYFIGLDSTLDYVYYPNRIGSFGQDINGNPRVAPYQVTVTPITLNPDFNPADNILTTDPGYYYNTNGSYTNAGSLVNNFSNLSHVSNTFSNTGSVTNQGDFTNQADFINTGSFNNTGTLANQGHFVNQNLLSNNGTLINTGELDINENGQIIGSGTITNTSQGLIEITGSASHVIQGDVTNEGTFKTTNTSAIFTGSFINNGRFESDPSTNVFTNLSIGSNGYLVGGTGDTFIVTGDFNNASTQNTLWNTDSANLIFLGANGTSHVMGLTGTDNGMAAGASTNNFAWGSITLNSGNTLRLIDGNTTPGAALYAAKIILPGGISQLKDISSDYNIYFNPNLADNQYLLGMDGSFGSGSGRLSPWSLVPFTTQVTADPTLTQNEQKFGQALDETCTAPVGQMILRCIQLQALNDAQKKSAIASLTPDQVPGQMAQPVKFSATRMEAPMLRLASLRTGAGTAPLSVNFNGIQLASGSGQTRLGGSAGDDEFFGDNPLGFFVQARFAFGTQQTTAWDRGFDSQTRTVTLGSDYRISENLVTGVAFNYTNQSLGYVQSSGFTDIDTYMGAIYGSYYLPNDFYLDWVANYGANAYQLQRRYGYQGFSGNSQAKPNGDQYSFALSSGTNFHYQEWSANPYIRAEYLNLQIEGYREQASDGFDVITNTQNNQSFVTDLGLQVSYAASLSWGVLSPSIRAEWEHQYLNDNRLIHMKLAQAAPGLGNFTIQTGNPDRDYVNLGTSLSAALPNGDSGFVRYETRLGQSYISDHIVEAGLRFTF